MRSGIIWSVKNCIISDRIVKRLGNRIVFLGVFLVCLSNSKKQFREDSVFF